MRPRLALAAAFLTLPLAGPALAANCAAHEDVVTRLAERYGESRQSIALGANNAVVEVFASLETGTWTITMTRPGGPTCLVAAGVAYEALAEALPNTDAPA
ncbi:hypothetical protein [Pseudoroseicyclus sp. CXY001]|uniref:hypothetical protein n=1 Tax=Pseudoroseicyclus sp. CXY001 TaxID=3242492 RepID=UPI00358DB45F